MAPLNYNPPLTPQQAATMYIPRGGGLALHLDFASPIEQPLPATPAALAAAMGTSNLASRVLRFDVASGNITDSAGGTWTVGSANLYQRRAVGIWDGSSFAPQIAMSAGATVLSEVSAPDTSVADIDGSSSFATLIVFRTLTTTAGGAGSQGIFGKRESSGDNRGWEIYVDSIGRAWMFGDDDDTTASNGGATAGHDDGAWHCLLAIWDRSTDEILCHTDIQESTGGDISSLTTLSNSVTASFFRNRIGTNPNMTIAYAAIFEGANAEGLTRDNLLNFWKVGADPTGRLTSYTRAGLIADVVTADGDVAYWSGNSSDHQIALGYRSGMGIGVRAQIATTNLLHNSVDLEDSTYWGLVGGTAAAQYYATDSPSGMRDATILESDNTDYLSVVSFSLTTGEPANISLWAKSTGAAHNMRLELYNSSIVLKETWDFEVTSEWQRFDFTHASWDGSTANGRIHFYGSDDGTVREIALWGPQCEVRDVASPYVPTSGASATCPVTALYTRGAAGGAEQWATGDRGQMTGVAALDHAAEGEAVNRIMMVFREHPDDRDTSLDNSRAMVISAGGKFAGFFYKADGALSHVNLMTADAVTTPGTYEIKWNAATLDGTNTTEASDPANAAAELESTDLESDDAPLVDLLVGNSGSLCWNGLIQSLKVYRRPRG